ncbi:MAG TPA: serine hydrolase domain-containing protein [Chitinophagaceae bacterium]|nr:serine hydrolase domain-containing protein [Chitinophagaceae bacterium]
MKRFTFLVFTITAFSVTSPGQVINVSKVDSFLSTLASKGLAMGSLAISKNGVVIYQKAIGYAYMGSDKKILADVHTKYRIGSATKMFTAVMTFQLIEEGKLSPGTKLAAYFPNLPNANKITISNMLYHRSGLHDYTKDTNFPGWMDKPKTHAELLEIIKDKGSDFEPGTKADYSNSNYLLLGYIIEKIGRVPYADALKKRITSKLNLKNTYYGSPIRIENNEAISYKYAENNWNKEKETNLSIHGGAGSIVSTSTDMVKFIDALFSYKLVSKSSLSKMETMIDGYGMGMFPNKYGSKKSFGHNGRIEEFYSAAWHFPDEKLSFAYHTNGINYPRTDLIEGVLKICFNEPFTLPFSKEGSLESEELDKYIGKYSFDQIVVNCTKDGTKLLLETKGKVFEVEKISDNYFMNASSGYFFEFYPDKGELQIKEADNTYHLKKAK